MGWVLTVVTTEAALGKISVLAQSMQPVLHIAADDPFLQRFLPVRARDKHRT